MLKKDYRLSKSKEIQRTSLHGRSFFNPFFTIKYRYAQDPVARFAFVASTKVSKKAVERNRLKRIIREQIRLEMANFKSGDYVIIVKRKAAGAVPADIRLSLLQLCRSTKLLR